MMTMKKELNVYHNDTLAGRLQLNDHGRLEFSYTKGWLSRSDPHPLSQSMPLQPEPIKAKQCRPFFVGILPEHSTRAWMAKHFGFSQYNDYALLDKIAGDCPGAVILKHASNTLDKPHYREISNDELSGILDVLYSKPLLVGAENLRQTLAGMQDKMAITIIDGKIHLPLNGAVSSHIIKPASLRFGGIVQNEAFCMKLAATVGIPAANVETRRAGSIEYLLVERFDRISHGNSYERAHQEDFCQALGVAPESKYQCDGGPRLSQCFELLRAASSTPEKDVDTLLRTVIFNYLIGNNDAHGKNFALLYAEDGVRLSPMYDLISTIVYGNLSTRMSMKIGDNYQSTSITPRDWEKFAQVCKLATDQVSAALKDMSSRITAAAENLAQEYPTARSIVDVIQNRTASI
jgi:serine/threonine-protein kinase HipA